MLAYSPQMLAVDLLLILGWLVFSLWWSWCIYGSKKKRKTSRWLDRPTWRVQGYEDGNGDRWWVVEKRILWFWYSRYSTNRYKTRLAAGEYMDSIIAERRHAGGVHKIRRIKDGD